MAYRVIYRQTADANLDAIYEWIADGADEDIALRYVLRIREKCERLADFPNRGTPHDDLLDGLRTIPFGRRVTIAYLVQGAEVIITRIVHAGLDLTTEFDGP
ncbi:MAG TPA: type II toxin-antitoxin system RelE/ParE family toxin [Allosphingosinicella sp.]